MRIVNFIFLLFGLLASCQSPKDKAKDQEKFDWNAGISAPKHYVAVPFVEYLYQGKSVAGASTSIGGAQGWGITMGGVTGGAVFKPVPDSVFVKWSCGFDLITYNGGFKLPREKMLELFHKGTIDPYTGNKEDYTVLVAGTAPGGNVTIWMQSGSIITEVAKFKAKKISQEGRYDPHSVSLWTSTGQEAKEDLKYINFHGVPYEAWEKGEKEYNYDIGFSSKEDKYSYDLTFNAKDGSWFPLDKFNSFIPWGENEIKAKNIIPNKHKSPVQLNIQWYSNEENYKERQCYYGKIVLPQNLETLLKSGLYNRLLISVEKDEHKDAVFGALFLIGKNNKEKIMTFKLGRYDYKLEKQLSEEYILPKDFVFPKWEKGKEPLKTPDTDYWQEK
ncbi:DUF2931 family protein [Flavobacterium sp. LS1R49]|uniref:DUF2931 family protein n=1 Tax=Flavobacterium shii TaxID=2987687 RepID=A0A9X2ZFY5_9FLAO|nr:DUF2931 family protein [Flavobacterium shii]MCV9929062.1 DUF2931 family protein [Flavobacterium shii]